ncbi:MAG: hypothetical protein AAGN66_05575 [Acidobacteriota bacterium]
MKPDVLDRLLDLPGADELMSVERAQDLQTDLEILATGAFVGSPNEPTLEGVSLPELLLASRISARFDLRLAQRLRDSGRTDIDQNAGDHHPPDRVIAALFVAAHFPADDPDDELEPVATVQGREVLVRSTGGGDL